jgi:hypothetical protein
MEAAEKEKARMRESNQAMMTRSTDGISATQPVLNDNVTIFCPRCNEGKEVDMNVFWKLDSSHRFVQTKCVSVSCGSKCIRIGKWLRRVSDVSVTVAEWLKQKGVYKSVDMKSAAVTKDSFMEQESMNDKAQNVLQTQLKRTLPTVYNVSSKKQCPYTQAVHAGASTTAVQTESHLPSASDDHVTRSAKTEKRTVSLEDSNSAKKKIGKQHFRGQFPARQQCELYWIHVF